MNYYEVTTDNGRRYGIQAIEIDGEFRPHVSELDANGEPISTVVDSEWTDEVYTDARECLYRAIVHVF